MDIIRHEPIQRRMEGSPFIRERINLMAMCDREIQEHGSEEIKTALQSNTPFAALKTACTKNNDAQDKLRILEIQLTKNSSTLSNTDENFNLLLSGFTRQNALRYAVTKALLSENKLDAGLWKRLHDAPTE